MPKASPYLKAIWTAGFPPGVRTRKVTRQGGSAARLECVQRAYLAARQKHQAGDYAAADALLEPAVKAALLTRRDDAFTAALFAEYASIQHDLTQWSRAEEFYRRALAIWTHLKVFGPEHVIVLNSLATLYMDRRQFTKAEELLKDAGEKVLSSTTAPGFLKAEILNTLGGLAIAREKFQDAESFYSRSLALPGAAPSGEV